jgi:hypothetical protein
MHLYLNEPIDRVLEPRLYPLTYRNSPRQTVTVYINGTFQDRLTLEPGWVRYRVKVPASVVRPGVNEITFKYGYAVEPAKVFPGSADTRWLAVGFDYVTLRRSQ